MAGSSIGDAEIVVGADAAGFEDSLASQAALALKKISGDIANGLRTGVEKGASLASRGLTKLWDGIKTGAAKAGSLAADALGQTLKIGTAAIATGVGVVLGTAISSGMKRLSAIDTAEARLKGLGLNAQDVEGVMATVSDAVMGTYFSTADMADAASLLLTSGVEAGDELAAALDGVKGIAASTGAEIGDVTTIWQKMAAAGKVSGREMEQLTSMGINGAAALAEQFGITQEEATKMVSAGEVSFEEFNEAIINSTGEMAEAVSGSFEGLKTSITGWLGLIGEQLVQPFFDAGKKIMPPIIDAMSEIPDAVENAMGPVSDIMENFSDKVAGFFENIDVGEGLGNAFAFIGDNMDLLIPAFTGAMAALGPLIANVPILGKVFGGLTGPIGIMIGLFIEMFRNSETLRDAFGNIMSTLGDVFSSLEPVFGAVSDIIADVSGTLGDVLGTAINAVLPLISSLASTLGPILGQALQMVRPLISMIGDALTGALGMALEMIVPILIQLAEQLLPVLMAAFQALMPIILTLVETGLSLFMAVLEALLPILMQLIEMALPVLMSLIEALVPVFEMIAPVITTVIEAIMPLVEMLLDLLIPVLESLMPIVETVFGVIESVISSVMTIIQGIISTVMALIKGDWKGVWDGIKQILSGVWDTIKAVVSGAVDIVKSVISSTINAIKTTWSTVWNSIKDTLSNIWNSIKSAVSSAIGAVQSTISSVTSSISGAWNSTWSAIKNFFSDIWNGIKSAASTAINNVYTTVTGIKSKITGFFSGAGRWLLDAGKSIVRGLANGIKNMISAPVDAIKGVVGKVRNFLPFSPAKEGPFSGKGWTPYSGAALVEGIAEGMRSGAGDVVNAARSVMDGAANALALPASPRLPALAGPGEAPAPVVVGGDGGFNREMADYLIQGIAATLWPTARAGDMVNDLASNGPGRRRRKVGR